MNKFEMKTRLDERAGQIKQLTPQLTTAKEENKRLRGLLSDITPEIEKVAQKLDEKGWLDLTVIGLRAWIRKVDEVLKGK